MRETDPLELITRYLDGSITAEDFATLNAALTDDTDLRRHFIGLTYTAQLMAENLNPLFGESPVPDSTLSMADEAPSRWRRSIGYFAAAAALLLAAAAWFITQAAWSTTKQQQAPGDIARPIVGLLTDTNNAVFVTGQPSMTLGSALGEGVIALESGTAQIMFDSTAVIDLTGPCEFEMIGPNRGRLTAGRLKAYVPTRARGFTMDLPTGARLVDLGTAFNAVVDLGTAFNAVVDPQHVTRILVTEGSVAIEHGPQRRIIAAGHLVAVHDSHIEVDSRPDYRLTPPSITIGQSPRGFNALSHHVPAPESADGLTDLTATCVIGQYQPGGAYGHAEVLFDGQTGTTSPTPDRAVTFHDGLQRVVFRVDLGVSRWIDRIITYSAHMSTRSYQHYRLYATDDPDAVLTDPAVLFIAQVNAGAETNFNGYRGVMIASVDRPAIVRCRYLLFEFLPRGGEDWGAGDFSMLHEIRIHAVDSSPAPVDASEVSPSPDPSTLLNSKGD